MLRLLGTVVLVSPVRRGSSLRIWDGDLVTVDDGSDFAEGWGRFTLDDDPVEYVYDSLGRNDEDGSATLVLPASLPGVDSGFVACVPAAVDVWAQVEVAGTPGALQCLVPHALRPLLVEGSASVRVWVERVGEQWQVADVLGRRAEVHVGALSQDVWDQVSASGGNHIWHRTTDPDMDGEQPGDLWFCHDPGSWATVGFWTWDGAVWQPSPIEGTVLTNVDAGSITTGALQGIDIASPSLTSVPRTQMTGDGFAVIRGTTAEPYKAAQLGGDEGDSLLMATPGGDVFGFTGGGDLVGRNAAVEALDVGGQSIQRMIEMSPRMISRQRLGSSSYLQNTLRWGTTELGLIELPLLARAGHTYRAVFDGYLFANGANLTQTMRLRRTYLNTGNPAKPSISSSQVAQADWRVNDTIANIRRYHFEAFINASNDEYQRLLWTMQNTNGFGYVASGDTWPSEFYVEDLGYRPTFNDGALNTGGGTPYSGSQQDPGTSTPTQSYTTTWQASFTRSWHLSNVYDNSGVLYTGRYGSDHRMTWALFGGSSVGSTHSGEVGKTLTTALSGATVTGARLTLSCTHTYYGSGSSVRISWHNQTSAPSSRPTVSSFPWATTNWVTGSSSRALPSTALDGLRTGSTRGFILGEPSGLSDLVAYAQFSSSKPTIRLEVDYVK